ncbi:MAG: GAF domain-containing protein [Alphaproteobacteria bacterium]
MQDDLERLLAAIAEPGQPLRIYQAMEEATRARVGHRLFTLLYVDGAEVARVHSSRPAEYPVSGRKPMGPTPWGAHVLAGRRPFLGRDVAAIRWAFYDAPLIEAMGLGSAINVPVVHDGATIGTMNLLDAEFRYREEDVAPLVRLAPVLVPAFLAARFAARAA